MQTIDKNKTINESLVVNEEYEVYGLVLGNITVVSGGDLFFEGLCCGDLIVEAGGKAFVNGVVVGEKVSCWD